VLKEATRPRGPTHEGECAAGATAPVERVVRKGGGTPNGPGTAIAAPGAK
jgi:hypothetical protein